MYFSTINCSSDCFIGFSYRCSALKAKFSTSRKLFAAITTKRHTITSLSQSIIFIDFYCIAYITDVAI